MKREARRQLIMEMLAERGAIQVEELALKYAVSKMTIHRDLDDLENEGLLRKVRGGATIEAGMQFESDFRFRERQDNEAKERIASEALKLIEPGMTIIINDGSMASVLGSMLITKRPLTVITNNAAIIDALRNQNGIYLIALGGNYSPKFNGFFGLLTEQNLANLRADIAFLSSPAVTGNNVFHMDGEVVRTKRAMLSAATKSCLMVNHSRFDHVALHLLANLEEFDWVIADQNPSESVVAGLKESGISLTVPAQ